MKDHEKEKNSLQEALTQVLYQNKMLLSWVQGAVITVDREGVVVTANEIALDSLGYREEELLGLQYHETFHHTLEDGGEYPWDFCPVFAAIEDGSSHHVTNDTFWKSDNSSFLTDYIVSPVRDENNQISGATIIFRNLTEYKLQEAKRIHGMKLESIGQLSAGIAHEINTPIQFIGSNISFMQEAFDDIIELVTLYRSLKAKINDIAEYKEILSEIAEQEDIADIEYLTEEVPKALSQTSEGVERVSQLVLGLKGFSHSADNAEKTEGDINEIITNTLIVCKNAYKYVANLELDLGEVPSIPLHHGDIGQVILNLIVNGAQAIEDNKKESDDMGTIRVSTAVEGEYLTITVFDSGGGIPEDITGRVFDPFFTTKEVGRGSGQGLAISRNIVHDKHGGELTFETEKGIGTTFTIKLPLS